VHDDLADDAWLIGRVTGQEFVKGKSYTVSTTQVFPRENWLARRDAKAYGIVLDAHGKIAWGRSDIGGDPIVVVLVEEVSDAHLAGLRSEGVSYIFAGKSRLDLELAPEILNRELGVERLLLEGGGGTNGAFSSSWPRRRAQSDRLSDSGRHKGRPERLRFHRSGGGSARVSHGDDTEEQPRTGRWGDAAALFDPERCSPGEWSLRSPCMTRPLPQHVSSLVPTRRD
jgi:hypothetical protein